MSIATETLRYGWKIVAGVVLTGATIYVADTTQERITQRDAIQVIMGTVERTMATQTGTNSDGSAIYAVAPPSFVRSWVSTNGMTGTNFAWMTNQVTNTISFYTDRAMMVDLDQKIKDLCPYYVDTNTVYDGTTNIAMLTVTGLFASLQIGDHTNQFTSIPCWTNNVGQTNCTTNAATFGPWAWRNYRVAWEERYKVLNVLTVTRQQLTVNSRYRYGDEYGTNYSALVSLISNNWSTAYGTNYAPAPGCWNFGVGDFSGGQIFAIEGWSSHADFGDKYFTTNLSKTVHYMTISDLLGYPDGSNGIYYFAFDSGGVPGISSNWTTLRTIALGYGSLITTQALNDANYNFPPVADDLPSYRATYRGWTLKDAIIVIDWQFNYCTNQYW